MPSISIIIPVYNTKQYLNVCLDSILRQSFSDFEILLIDDGSSDGSGLVCDSFARKDTRVRTFHTENKGVSSARNLGLDYARGLFVVFVDSDDELPDGALSSMISIGVADFSVGGLLRVFQGGRKQVFKHHADRHYRKGERERFFDDAFSKMVLMEAPTGKLYRTEIIRQHGLRFDEKLHYGEDKAFVFSFLLHAESFIITTEIVYIQKRREGSLSSDIVSSAHLSPLIDFLRCYVDIVRVYQREFSCQSVQALYPIDVIRRYVFRYLNIVRTIDPKYISSQHARFISSLLKGYKEHEVGTTGAYLNLCIWIGRYLPNSFFYWFLRSLNAIR